MGDILRECKDYDDMRVADQVGYMHDNYHKGEGKLAIARESGDEKSEETPESQKPPVDSEFQLEAASYELSLSSRAILENTLENVVASESSSKQTSNSRLSHLSSKKKKKEKFDRVKYDRDNYLRKKSQELTGELSVSSVSQVKSKKSSSFKPDVHRAGIAGGILRDVLDGRPIYVKKFFMAMLAQASTAYSQV